MRNCCIKCSCYWKGNQVWSLSDPVTVYREWTSKTIAYPIWREKVRETMICKPGNLLDMRDALPSKAKHSTRCRPHDLPRVSRYILWMECCLKAMEIYTNIPPYSLAGNSALRKSEPAESYRWRSASWSVRKRNHKGSPQCHVVALF